MLIHGTCIFPIEFISSSDVNARAQIYLNFSSGPWTVPSARFVASSSGIGSGRHWALDLASLPELQKGGSLLLKNTALGPVLLISQPAPVVVQAVDPRCPHDGCLVNWKSSNKLFVCPCHGAEFKASGQLSKGPAKSPLTSFKASVVNGRILVSAA